MIEHYYTPDEIKVIRENFHKTLEFRKQFEKIEINEDEAIKNFLGCNFKVGSINDPLLDCFGEAIFKYKFKQASPKRINNMINNTVNNLPHIMDAQVVASTPATSNETVLDGGFCTITYSAKPSSKKPGKAIIAVNIAYGEEELAFKYSSKIENASEEILTKNFNILKKACDAMFHLNVSLEEAEDDQSKKGVFNAHFEAKEVETYGQYFEIEPVDGEINFAKPETVVEFVKQVFEATSEYQKFLESVNEGSTKVITIVKGGKNDIEYMSDSSPVVCGNLIKLEGNFTSEETFVSALDVKTISEHILTEEDLEQMNSVICSELTEAEVEPEVTDEPEEVDEIPEADVEAPETEGL